MKNWSTLLIVLVLGGLVIGAWFFGRISARLEKEKQLEDTVNVLHAKFVGDLNECWKKVIQQTPPISTPIFTARKKLSHDDSVKIAQIMSYATQGKLDSLLAVVERLSATKFGMRSWDYEDENVWIAGTSMGSSSPLESDTIHIETGIDDLRLKSLPRDTIVVTIQDDSKPFIDSPVLTTQWYWIFKSKKSEASVAAGLPINVGKIRFVPNAGFHSILKLNAGVVVEYIF
jgi:hypothetical protein